MYISLAFVSRDEYPRKQEDVDQKLLEGTKLFNVISVEGNFLLISEIPKIVEIGGNVIHLECRESRSGLMSQSADDPESMTYSIIKALRHGYKKP